MATERRVRKTGKNREGDITSLCSDGEWWSPRTMSDSIRDIENDAYRYYVEQEAPRVYVKVVSEGGKKYLRTTSDKSSKNNLDNLPDC